MLRVQHFRVELGAIQATGLILRGSHRAVRCVRYNFKTGSCLLNIIVVAHPADVLVRQRIKQRAGRIQIHQRFTILPFGGFGHMATQLVHHQLTAVADTKNGHTPVVNIRVNGGRIRQISAVGAAGKDETLGVFGLDFSKVGAVRLNLAIHIAFTDTAGNQLVILAAEVQNDDGFLLHEVAPFPFQSLVVYHISRKTARLEDS